MKVFLSTLGSGGDIVTFARLAGALAQRGHSVTAHTWPHYTAWFPDGVHTVAADADVTAQRFHDTLSAALQLPTPWAQIQAFSALFHGLDAAPEVARRQYVRARAAAAGHDIAVCNVLDQLGQTAATAAGVPWLSWASRPPPDPALTDGPDALGPVDAALSQHIATVTDGTHRTPVRVFRTRAPDGDLAACSPLLMPPQPADPRLLVTGAWLDPTPATPLPDALASFVDAGATLLITFGTLPDRADRTAHLIAAGLAAGWRVVAQVLPPSPPPTPRDGLFVIRSRVSYPALLPRVRAVVHHGGAGTLHEITRAGKPSVAMPHMADQYFWAQAAHRLGLGPAPIPYRERDPQTLRARLAALRHRRYTAAARTLAPQIAAEDGVMKTVEHLEARFGEAPAR